MNVCQIEGCNRTVRCRGLCGSHYERARLSGGLANALILRAGRKPAPLSLHCPGVAQCGRQAQARGLCAACYQLRLRHEMLPRLLVKNRGSNCSTDGCTKSAIVKGRCKQCYRRARRAEPAPRATPTSAPKITAPTSPDTA